jgi:hypothetical protein
LHAVADDEDDVALLKGEVLSVLTVFSLLALLAVFAIEAVVAIFAVITCYSVLTIGSLAASLSLLASFPVCAIDARSSDLAWLSILAVLTASHGEWQKQDERKKKEPPSFHTDLL